MVHLFNKVNSRLSTIMVGFDAGSRLEGGGGFLSGSAHMLEHSIFKGTSKRGSLDISRDMGFLGGFANAFTSHEMVGYYVTVPYENLEPAIEILSDIVLNSTIPDDEFLKEVEVVKEEEISRLDDIDSYMWNSFSSEFFSNYISVPVIGTQESISSFTRDSIYSFYRNFCKRDMAVVSVSGNHTKRYAKKLMTRYFGKDGAGSVSNYSGEYTQYSAGGTTLISKPGIEHTYVWVSYPGIERENALDPATKVLSCILGAGMDSRLFFEIREKRGLAYSIGTSHSQWDKASIFSVDSSTRGTNVEEMLDVISYELSDICNELVSDEEIERAKNKIRASFYATVESSYGMASYAVRRRLFGLRSIDELIDCISSVTRDDVKSAANVLFQKDDQTVLICEPG